jgi:hypothetical protein
MSHINPTNSFTIKVNNNIPPSKIPIKLSSQGNSKSLSNLLERQIEPIDPRDQKKSSSLNNLLNRIPRYTCSLSTKKTITFIEKSEKACNEFIPRREQYLETQSSANIEDCLKIRTSSSPNTHVYANITDLYANMSSESSNSPNYGCKSTESTSSPTDDVFTDNPQIKTQHDIRTPSSSNIDYNNTNKINNSEPVYAKIHFPPNYQSLSNKVAHNSTTKSNNSGHKEVSNHFSLHQEPVSFKGIAVLKQNRIIITNFKSCEKKRNFSQYLFGKFFNGMHLETNIFNLTFLSKATPISKYIGNLTQYGSFDPNMLHQETGSFALGDFFCIQHLNKKSLFEYTIIPSMLNIGSRIFIHSKPYVKITQGLVLDIISKQANIVSKQANNFIVLGIMESDCDDCPLVIPCVTIDTRNQKFRLHDLKNGRENSWVSTQNISYGFVKIKQIEKSFKTYLFDTIFFNWLRKLKAFTKNNLQINYGYCNSEKDSFLQNTSNNEDFFQDTASNFAGISIVLEKKSTTFSCGKYTNNVSDSETTILDYRKNLECDLPSFKFNNQEKGLSICLDLEKKRLKIDTLLENRGIRANLGEKGVIIVND